MTSRVSVRPELLCWARDRARLDPVDLATPFPQLAAWECEEKQPTFRQLERFARATRTPVGYLFLPEPPQDRMPIPDFRTVAGEVARPSPDLLDTIHAMQRRQAWLREEQLENGADAPDFVGAASLTDDPQAVGREMRRIVGVGDGWAATVDTWQAAVRHLRRTIESLGVMAVINGIVGNNPHRKLDVEEFRGFALCDAYAPLIFVNGADGEGLSGFDLLSPDGGEVELFCEHVRRERRSGKGTGGGDFYSNQNTRVGEIFATQVISAAMEGRIGFKEAYELTGLRGGAFQEYARRLGVDLP